MPPTICPLCNHATDSVEHIMEEMLLKIIREEHPEWVEQNGLCPKCVAYYRNLDHELEVVDE